jgi:hypothetical protein
MGKPKAKGGGEAGNRWVAKSVQQRPEIDTTAP